jgi:predicted cation transporter
MTMITYLLILIFLIILLFPILFKTVERHIELFLLIVGIVTVTLSHVFGPRRSWSFRLVESALVEPIKITVATFLFGFLFRAFREFLKRKIVTLEKNLGPRFFAFALILALGLLSSVITAIIAALVLCEVVSALNLDKKYETLLVILACFSIGMGAALTPIGEPLSTIALAKLRTGAHNTDFWFLIRLLGVFILPGLLVISLVGWFLRGNEVSRSESLSGDYAEPVKLIFLRAAMVYVFVAALVLLGAGFKPIIDSHVSKMPAQLLYWVNMSSAVLDNATLAAAELGPQMDTGQIKGILMGIIISGGMLIPGNIPNIIASSKLGISSRAWAVAGAPFGLFLMAVYYAVLYG